MSTAAHGRNKFVEVVRTLGRCTISDVRDATGNDWVYVSTQLRRLYLAGALHREGKLGTTAYYSVAPGHSPGHPETNTEGGE